MLVWLLIYLRLDLTRYGNKQNSANLMSPAKKIVFSGYLGRPTLKGTVFFFGYRGLQSKCAKKKYGDWPSKWQSKSWNDACLNAWGQNEGVKNWFPDSPYINHIMYVCSSFLTICIKVTCSPIAYPLFVKPPIAGGCCKLPRQNPGWDVTMHNRSIRHV